MNRKIIENQFNKYLQVYHFTEDDKPLLKNLKNLYHQEEVDLALCSEDFMFGDDKEKWAVNELVRKSEELKRLPRKDDFDDATRSRIKAFLGPWPRALEKAGLKTPGGKRKK